MKENEIILRPESAQYLTDHYDCKARREDRIALVFDSAEDCKAFKEQINSAGAWVRDIVELYSGPESTES